MMEDFWISLPDSVGIGLCPSVQVKLSLKAIQLIKEMSSRHA